MSVLESVTDSFIGMEMIKQTLIRLILLLTPFRQRMRAVVSLQVVSVKLSNGVDSVDTLAVCDTGSTLSFVDSGIKSLLGIDGTKFTLSVAGINGTKDMTCGESLGTSICKQL